MLQFNGISTSTVGLTKVLFFFQLWENAIHFWTDLQHYRELFYQDGLDPYRVQREAQVSTLDLMNKLYCVWWRLFSGITAYPFSLRPSVKKKSLNLKLCRFFFSQNPFQRNHNTRLQTLFGIISRIVSSFNFRIFSNYPIFICNNFVLCEENGQS